MKLVSHFAGLMAVTVLWVLALIPAGIAALMSPMMFDAGQSGLAWTMFTFIASWSDIIAVSG